jgi:membrane protein insertase Oxa1/YidC/SpoIIIJ
LDLSKPNWVLAILRVGPILASQNDDYRKPPAIVRKDSGSADENMAAMMNKQMLYFMPALTIIIGVGLPGGLTLYWLVVTLFTAFQQVFIFNKILKGCSADKDITLEK